MTDTDENTLTPEDLATLLRDGHPGLEANVTRKALKRVVDEWENHPKKAEKLEALRESPIGYENMTPEIKYDPDEETYHLGPNKGPGVLNSLKPSGTFYVAGEFAEDYFQAHCEIYNELLEQSSLTKKQFMVYLMKEGNQNEHTIARELGMETGTVRSHAGRARKKVEKAQNTAKIPELFTFGGYDKLQAEMAELLEPASA